MRRQPRRDRNPIPGSRVVHDNGRTNGVAADAPAGPADPAGTTGLTAPGEQCSERQVESFPPTPRLTRDRRRDALPRTTSGCPHGGAAVLVCTGRSLSVYGKERALMREILGRRRRFMWPMGRLKSMWLRRKNDRDRSAVRTAALICAERVAVAGAARGRARAPAVRQDAGRRSGAGMRLPAAGLRGAGCAPARSRTAGGHHGPADGRLVVEQASRRTAPAGDRRHASPRSACPRTPASAPCARWSTAGCDSARWWRPPPGASCSSRPYSLEELGELLAHHDWVPSSLRYHGHGGYVALPPSHTGTGQVCWERAPQPEADGGAPWLPDIRVIVDTLVEIGVSAPDGSRLAY